MALLSLQSSASALSALNTALDVTANNLANVNTPGFKSSRANFQDLLYIEKEQPGSRNTNNDQRPIGLYVGLGTKIAGTQQDFTQGPTIKGNKLDLLIQGNGFFRVSVQDSIAPGGFAYTRSGQFTLNSDGEIVTATGSGRRLEPRITVDGEVTDISIDTSGQVFVTRPGNAQPEQVGAVTLTNFINPVGLRPIGENMFTETGASGPAIEGTPGETGFGQLIQGSYEGSNVDPTTELINLIRVQRAFEMNSNTIRAADQTLQAVAQLHR